LFGKILEDPADSNDTRREVTRALAEISEDHFDRSETTIRSRDNQLVSIREFDSSTHTTLLAFSPSLTTHLSWPEIATHTTTTTTM
jgi:hypothetical protein